MASIQTNVAALSALQTLRSVGNDLQKTQGQISSGLRIADAGDNAAYWSISTTMRSDNKAISAVHDGLGLSSAMVDVAYTGMAATLEVLDEFKSKLVATSQPGVDRGKVQTELEQLKQQVHSIAESSSFNGVNWLNTEVEDLYDTQANKIALISSFTRDSNNNVSLGTSDMRLSATALFNEHGGGLLQSDPRFLDTIGGMREWVYYTNQDPYLTDYNVDGGNIAARSFTFTGPMTFGAGDTLSFDITFDADNPADGITAPHHPGETRTVTVNRALVNSVLSRSDGVIPDWLGYISVLNKALDNAGAYPDVNFDYSTRWIDYPITWEYIENYITLRTSETSGLDGSSLQISNFTSTAGTGGLSDFATIYGRRDNDMLIDFKPFTVFKEVEVDFDFGINGETRDHYIFDRDYVNATLGVTNGRVGTAEEMATLLNTLIDRPEIIIEATDDGNVRLRSDELIDRLSGSKTYIGFTNIVVNVEPLPMLNFDNIDVARAPTLLPEYLDYMETAMARVTDGAATLGALQKRLELQTEFTASLMETIDIGIGQLVDADMNESSTRLKALETQSQLAIQALSIANSQPQSLMQLFQ